jgi:hypothetical protein
MAAIKGRTKKTSTTALRRQKYAESRGLVYEDAKRRRDEIAACEKHLGDLEREYIWGYVITGDYINYFMSKDKIKC